MTGRRGKPTRELIALILTVTMAICVLALVGAAVYAIVLNAYDWAHTHIKGPNLTNPLAAVIGSIMSAVIAGVVGYIGGVRVGRTDVRTYNPAPEDPVNQVGSAVNEVLDKITRRG